ncbi:MAG: serine protease [SAR202 cluster bacterium]|nr:serine protease [SAR202 cluster bacterium]
MGSRLVAVIGVLLVLMLVGCGGSSTSEEATSTPTLMPTAVPTLAAPTATPAGTPLPQPLNSAEIFEMVSPSVVFIDTPSGTGSGFVIDGGYIVTNVHVTWPWNFVRVVFPDGSELSNVEVISTDWLTDFAILGPVVTNAPTVALNDGEDLPVGSEVYLIGYPAETETNPQPSFTKGIISRFREWELGGVTYIQTDAAIAGGQSGGILVSADAEVIGISGFRFSDAGFGLVASANDIGPRIQAIIEGGEIPFGNLYNPIPSVGGQSIFLVSLEGSRYGMTYVVKQGGTVADLTVTVEGENDAVLLVTDALGAVRLIVDETASGVESFSETVAVDRPVYVTVAQIDDFQGEFTLSSNLVLIPWLDPDDSREIEVGVSDAGNIDHGFDADQWHVELEGNKTYSIAVDSALIDPYLTVDLPGTEIVQEDDDSLGGLWGFGSQLFFTAPADGIYRVTIHDSTGERHGGYVLGIVEIR